MKRNYRIPSLPGFVYVLEDPRQPGNIRYIGSTQSPCSRLKTHVCEAKKRGKLTASHIWIRSLLAESLSPQIRILWQGPLSQMLEMEWKAIKGYRQLGFDLTNTTDTPEFQGRVLRQFMKDRKVPNTPFSAEHRKKISEGKKGVKFSPSHRAAISKGKKGTHPKLTAKYREALRNRMKGNQYAKKQS